MIGILLSNSDLYPNCRVNIGVAQILGMAKELVLTGNRYNIALLVFFPGYFFSSLLVNFSYFLFDLPSNLLIRKFGTANWLVIIIVGWGIITIGIGFVYSWHTLALLRGLLGIFEVQSLQNAEELNFQAGFFPGCVYLISCWYKRYEVQTRLAFFYMSSVFAAGFSVEPTNMSFC